MCPHQNAFKEEINNRKKFGNFQYCGIKVFTCLNYEDFKILPCMQAKK